MSLLTQLNRLTNRGLFIRCTYGNHNTFCSKIPDKKPIPKSEYKEVFASYSQKENGEIYDKKPFKMTLEAGKSYHWCLCGKSHTQPLCDKTHQSIYLKIKLRPVRFKVEETKDYWLCNCKQTKNRPFCDGAHKNKEVQDAHTKV